MNLSRLKINPNNPQKFNNLSKLENSIKKFPKMFPLRPMVYDPKTMQILGGNKRLICLQNLGFKEIPDTWIVSADELTEDEKKRFIIADNIGFGEWDFNILETEFNDCDIESWGLELNEFKPINLPSDEQKEPEVFEGFICVLKIKDETFPLVKESIEKICIEYGIEINIS